MNRLRYRIVLLCLILGSLRTFAQEPVLLNSSEDRVQLSDSDRAFIDSRIARLDLAQCRRQPLRQAPRADFRYLVAWRDGQQLRIYIRPDVLRNDELVLVAVEDNGLVEYSHCNFMPLLPVLAIMATAELPERAASNDLRQQVLVENSFLSSHDPSYLWLRNDDLDSSASYMDFSVSLKHPVLPNAGLVNRFHDGVGDLLENLIPGDDEYFMQLYLAFSGRFSQYIGERNSAPVVARRFNPSLFYRIWTSSTNYLDLEFGHESNGQRINSASALQREEQEFLNDNEPAFYARDSLSRGWDYLGLNWQRSWNDRLLTRLGLRHFLADGPLQDEAEEYNLWEDGGDQLHPRRQYAGLSLDLQYNFNRSRCLLGSLPVCFRKVALQQETGLSSPFEHNTTTLELTTDLGGMPIQLWGKTGYNTNLVDYYRYTSSWGIGFELLSN